MYHPLIYDNDLDGVLLGLGMVEVLRERASRIFAMPVEYPWRVIAACHVGRWDADKGIYQVRLHVSHVDAGQHRIGTVYWTESCMSLRRLGQGVMQHVFKSVEEADENWTCGHCQRGWLGWQGSDPTKVGRRPVVRCHTCGWEGAAESFRALKQLA
jgi:hypothetical protein